MQFPRIVEKGLEKEEIIQKGVFGRVDKEGCTTSMGAETLSGRAVETERKRVGQPKKS